MKKSEEFEFSWHEIDNFFETDSRSSKKENMIHIYDVIIIDGELS